MASPGLHHRIDSVSGHCRILSKGYTDMINEWGAVLKYDGWSMMGPDGT